MKRITQDPVLLGVAGFFSSWVFIAAIAGSDGGPTHFGVFSVVCGGLMYLAVVGISLGRLIRSMIRRQPQDRLGTVGTDNQESGS